MMEVQELLEPHLDLEEWSTQRLPKEPRGLLNKRRQHSGSSGAEPELFGAESSGLLPAFHIRVPQVQWGLRGGEAREQDVQETLLHSCCSAEGSIDQASPSLMLEYLVYLDDQHSPANRPMAPPAPPVTRRPPPVMPVPAPVHTTAPAVNSAVDPVFSGPLAHSCTPITSMCSPTGSAWDALRSTTSGPGCSDQDPVSAAAHLHLLGESLSLIGRHLQDTDKMVCISSSLSLLLDSLLCAVAPLFCLTSEIPELKDCTRHTLASTLENIAYVIPGL